MTLRRRAGAVMWAAGLLGAALWGGLRTRSVDARGVGFAPPVQVAPIEPGRLLQLDVELHDAVSAGDVVARIDATLVDAERELAAATLLATRDRLGIEVATESRRFAESAEGSMLTRAQLRTSIHEDQALLRTLKERLAQEEELVRGGAAAGLDADEVSWEIEVVEARLRESRRSLALADQAAANAETRNAEAPGLNRWELVAAARYADLLDRRRELYDVTAGIDGHVTMIYASPGSMVGEGFPILEIRRQATTDVVAWVPPSEVAAVAAGEPATVVRATGERLEARVRSVGGSPLALPMHLWSYPELPEYGVPVRLELVEGAVAPDEPVSVRM